MCLQSGYDENDCLLNFHSFFEEKKFPRQTVISLKAEPVSWLERITAQLDGFPVFIKSRSSKNGRKISRDSIQNYDELQSWIKVDHFSRGFDLPQFSKLS